MILRESLSLEAIYMIGTIPNLYNETALQELV